MENGKEAREIGWIVLAPFIGVTSSSIVSIYLLLIELVSEPADLELRRAEKDRGISVVAGKSATWRGVEYRGTFCTPLSGAGCWLTCFQ